jgi:DNA-binding Xre family transcriptional regulator
MLAKLDMANNDIVNAKNISAASLSTTGDISGFKFVVNKLLNMNNNDIVDAKNISAVNLSTTNGIQAANISATGSVVGNTISGFTFVVNKVLNMNNNDIVAAKNISAAGLSTTGDITTAATQKLETGYLKLQGKAGENNACGSGFTNSLSLDASDPNKLLRCDGSKWVTMTQKGATGDTGATGATGPPGAKNFGTNTEGGTCTSVNELS